MSGLWPPSRLSARRRAQFDAVQAMEQDRLARIREAHRERGGITPDQIRDVLVLGHLTEDLVTGDDEHHRYYGLVAG